jgi:signal transduction histidine kinase/sugar lactone lactonase YvrE
LLLTLNAIYFIDNDLNIIKQSNDIENIRSVLKIDKNNYLMGSEYGNLFFVEVQDDYKIKINKKKISNGYALLSMEHDKDGNIWIGSENVGLFIYNVSTDKLLNYRADSRKSNSISSNSIWALQKARNGVMWIGQFKQGLNFYDSEYRKFEHIENNPFEPTSLSNDNVNCFLEDKKGNIWIGTDGGGLDYWNRSKNSFEHYSLNNGKLHTNVVFSLLEDNKNQLWVGSWGHGLAIFEPNRKTHKVLNAKNSFLKTNYIVDLLEDEKGRIWIVSQYGGLHVYYPETGVHKNIDIRSENSDNLVIDISRIAQDAYGNIWVGTENSGLFKIVEKIENNDWSTTHYCSTNVDQTLSNNYVNTITTDSEGIVWVGTESGLNKYDSINNTFTYTSKKEGLVNDAIKGIIEDKNNFLWLSTGKGIIKYSPTDNSILSFDDTDGLQGNEFNSNSFFKTQDGKFLYGGSNGFNIFEPHEIKKRVDQPEVNINALKIYNSTIFPNDKTKILKKHISLVDSLTLSYNDAVIGFEYNTLTFRHPEKVEYAYFLEGFEAEWNYVGTRKSATYTNLNPGKYTLKIKSTNSDGVWNDKETSLHITVIPPFWKTKWFIALVFILTALIIYFFHYLNVRSIKKYQVQLEQRIDERTKELLQQKNKLMEVADELSVKNEEIQRFAFAVSHDLKSPLSSIKGIASIIPMEFVLKDFPDLENYLEMINISCDTMNDLIADITKIARLGTIENNKEVLDTKEIMDLAKTLVSGKLNVQNVELTIASNLPTIYGDRNRMIQVFGNLLDNAIKYMGEQKHPKVEISAVEDATFVQIHIADNGSGMDEKSLQKLFSPFERFHANTKGTGLGLYMIKQIVESHGGTITATSEGLGKGATFIISMKKAS